MAAGSGSLPCAVAGSITRRWSHVRAMRMSGRGEGRFDDGESNRSTTTVRLIKQYMFVHGLTYAPVTQRWFGSCWPLFGLGPSGGPWAQSRAVLDISLNHAGGPNTTESVCISSHEGLEIHHLHVCYYSTKLPQQSLFTPNKWYNLLPCWECSYIIWSQQSSYDPSDNIYVTNSNCAHDF